MSTSSAFAGIDCARMNCSHGTADDLRRRARELREAFMKRHADLLEARYWREKQQRIRAGVLEDVFPYPDALRFRHRLAPGASLHRSGAGATIEG